MNKYNGLLAKVAERYHISQGANESANEWKTRLIYSICGLMAYASLWDETESPSAKTAAANEEKEESGKATADKLQITGDGADEEAISFVHLRRRVHNIISSYQSLYPELANNLPANSKPLEDEIKELFLTAGVSYHIPYRIIPAIKRQETYKGILFQRGIALDDIPLVSGMGFYAKAKQEPHGTTTADDCSNSAGVRAMFGLSHETLATLWSTTLATASWQKKDPSFTPNVEYLRIEQPFSRGYWENSPSKDTVALLRVRDGGASYYLYRYVGSTLEVSQLPPWQVENQHYRTLACACLSNHQTLPSIEYAENGALVHLHLGYLLPPRELAFLKLYSWPETCATLRDKDSNNNNFRRILSLDVFTAIKHILFAEGYQFKSTPLEQLTRG